MTLKIDEVFTSVQGEGSLSGTGALFIRLRGCNALAKKLDCAEWCDTQYAWNQLADQTSEPILWTSDRLEQEVRDSQMPLIVFTGGEPLLQRADLEYWVARTTSLLEGSSKIIAFETNGTIRRYLPKANKMWWTVSPKPPLYSIESGPISEIKVVIPNAAPEEWYFNNGYRFKEWLEICPRVFVQPQDNDLETAAWIASELIPKHPHVRLNLQLHKLIAVR